MSGHVFDSCGIRYQHGVPRYRTDGIVDIRNFFGDIRTIPSRCAKLRSLFPRPQPGLARHQACIAITLQSHWKRSAILAQFLGTCQMGMVVGVCVETHLASMSASRVYRRSMLFAAHVSVVNLSMIHLGRVASQSAAKCSVRLSGAVESYING